MKTIEQIQNETGLSTSGAKALQTSLQATESYYNKRQMIITLQGIFIGVVTVFTALMLFIFGI